MSDSNRQRQQLLDQINRDQAERNLKPVRKLGDQSRGEWEITGRARYVEPAKKYISAAIFPCLKPDGTKGEHIVHFNANSDLSDGAVVLLLVNDKWAIVKQWRLTVSRWTYETPRQFENRADAKVRRLNQTLADNRLHELNVADLPLGLFGREIGEDFVRNSRVGSVIALGSPYENTGTHGTALHMYYCSMFVDQKILDAALQRKSNEGISLELWEKAAIFNEPGRKLNDLHSISAVALYRKHIAEMLGGTI